MTLDNLLSGLLGGFVVFILGVFYSSYQEAIRLNNIRTSVRIYIEKIAIKKLNRLIDDLEKALRTIERTITEEERSTGLDQMPMLTSEPLKVHSPNDLKLACFTEECYTEVVEFYYMVDFLKNNMPMNIVQGYYESVNNHLESKHIDIQEERLAHLDDCEYLKQKKESAIRTINLRLGTARGALCKAESIVNQIGGIGFNWILKYMGPDTIQD